MSDNDNLRDKQIDTIIARLATCVDRISELNARMLMLIDQQSQSTTRLDRIESRVEAQLSSMNGRVNDLEKWLWRLSGFGGAILVAFEGMKFLK